MDEIFIISNDRFHVNKKNFFNSNKNTFTIISCFKKLKKIYLIARTSRQREKFRNKISNLKLVNISQIYRLREKIKEKKTLMISLTPYNFLVACIFIFMGVKKSNLFLFLRSDGYKEYSIKYGKLGGFFYYVMLSLVKKRFNIFTCSASIKGVANSRIIYPSEITKRWLINRKKKIKKINSKNPIKLLYLGRLRKEKGFIDLIKIFNNLKINCNLTIVGNDFEFLKKKNYPKNSNIKIFGQVSSEKKLIKFYDNSDIFILPSYTEAYPQVILESLARLKPVIIFEEISFLKSKFRHGLFCCYRNHLSLEKTIKKIIDNYGEIQISIYENKLYLLKDFQIQMNNILNKKFDDISKT